jgi:hypothetical protein
VPFGVAQSCDSMRCTIDGGGLVDGQGVAAAAADGVDPGVVAGGVDAVGQPAAGQGDVGAFGRGSSRGREEAVVDGGALGGVDLRA